MDRWPWKSKTPSLSPPLPVPGLECSRSSGPHPALPSWAVTSWHLLYCYELVSIPGLVLGWAEGSRAPGGRLALSNVPTPSSWAQLGARNIQESILRFSLRWKKFALPFPLEEVGACLTHGQAGAALKGHLGWALLRG